MPAPETSSSRQRVRKSGDGMESKSSSTHRSSKTRSSDTKSRSSKSSSSSSKREQEEKDPKQEGPFKSGTSSTSRSSTGRLKSASGSSSTSSGNSSNAIPRASQRGSVRRGVTRRTTTTTNRSKESKEPKESGDDATSSKTGSDKRSSPSRRTSKTTTPAAKPKPEKRKANRPTVSNFLRNTHRELKQQIVTLQSHIKFVQDLATKTDEKKIDLLFKMIDCDGGGTVDAGELASAMRQNDELSVSESIEKAIDMVATFDTNGDGELDIEEFHNYVVGMVKELGVSLSDFCEFLIVQLLMAEPANRDEQQSEQLEREHIQKEVKKREALFAVLSSETMSDLFHEFDEQDISHVAFQDVAKAVHQIAKTCSKSVQEALEVIFLIDKHDTRMLDYEGFGRTIMSVVKAMGKSLEDVADALTHELANQANWDNFDNIEGNEEDTVFTGIAGSSTSSGEDEKIDSRTYSRLKKLFRIWDANGDGDISTDELSDGLRQFQAATGLDVDPDALARTLIKFDEDGDDQLDPREFSHAMVHYAKSFGVELDTLIDFMCLSSAIGQEEVQDFHQDFGLTKSNADNETATQQTHSLSEEDQESQDSHQQQQQQKLDTEDGFFDDNGFWDE